MKAFYGLLLSLIGLFNIYIGYIYYNSSINGLVNLYKLSTENKINYEPHIIIGIGLLYLIIGIISIKIQFNKKKTI